MKVLVYGPGFSSFRQLPEWDYAPTGKVSFEFDLYLRYPSALRRSFKDAKIQRLENMANDVAVGLAVLVAATREEARRADEDRLRAEEAARSRNEARRPADVEERRPQVLDVVLWRVDQIGRVSCREKVCLAW